MEKQGGGLANWFYWWSAGTGQARRALIASSLGWMLDAFDVMLYALVLASLMSGLGMSKETGGLLGSLTLIASAVGGVFFGVIADRFGRTRALMGSILVYSVFTAACGFSRTIFQLAVFRVLLGFGMGGEWASGAALVSETWPPEHRGKALGFMQSFWAIGYALAVLVSMLILPHLGWRWVFFAGVLPALFVFWIRRRVDEPEIWLSGRRKEVVSLRNCFLYLRQEKLLGVTVAVTVMNALTLFAWWGFNLWIPSYLGLPVENGGMGFSSGLKSGLMVAMQVGMWLGYITFGYISDSLGRKRTYMIYLFSAAFFILLYSIVHSPLLLLLVGPLVAFFGTGYFSGFGAVTAELYPTVFRATLQGFTYNAGRIASALGPFLVGSLAETQGFSFSFRLITGVFLLAGAMWIMIPETRGRQLT